METEFEFKTTYYGIIINYRLSQKLEFEFKTTYYGIIINYRLSQKLGWKYVKLII